MNEPTNTFNVALVFEDSIEKRIIALSNAITAAQKSSGVLGRETPPHLTLVQFEGHHETVNSCWRSIASCFPRSVELHFSGLTFLPSTSGGTWIEISVQRSILLENLQRRVLQVISPLIPLNKVGERYRPHVTLAKIDTLYPGPVALDPNLLRSTVEGVPALGVSGGAFEFNLIRKGRDGSDTP